MTRWTRAKGKGVRCRPGNACFSVALPTCWTGERRFGAERTRQVRHEAEMQLGHGWAGGRLCGGGQLGWPAGEVYLRAGAGGCSDEGVGGMRVAAKEKHSGNKTQQKRRTRWSEAQIEHRRWTVSGACFAYGRSSHRPAGCFAYLPGRIFRWIWLNQNFSSSRQASGCVVQT